MWLTGKSLIFEQIHDEMLGLFLQSFGFAKLKVLGRRRALCYLLGIKGVAVIPNVAVWRPVVHAYNDTSGFLTATLD